MDWVDRLTSGDERALARAISAVEAGAPSASRLLRGVFPRTGAATVVGITGPPGAGKSSLVDAMVTAYRSAGRRVGVIAVDPSSAYSGGAILGDRVRMQRHATDEGVFIRSMATRGHLGGLSRTTNDAVDLLDAAGYDPILLETVGVGQDEIEVARSADVVAVVLMPGMGDDIQAIKAGILETADLFVINKADRPGADRVAADLDAMLSLVAESEARRPEILRTVAVRAEGIAELLDACDRFLAEQGADRRRARRRERAETRLLGLLRDRLLERVLEGTFSDGAWDATVRAIADRELDPYTAVEKVLERVEVK